MRATLPDPASAAPIKEADTIEVWVIMPCLNEARTLDRCVAEARSALQEMGVRGEVVIADHGSSDGSAELAASQGARVVHVRHRGDHPVMGSVDHPHGRSHREPVGTKSRFAGVRNPDSLPAKPALEVSVVIPCLNEADTLASCIEKARRALHDHHIPGEILVADNGSTDGSLDIATRKGARVIHVVAKGYGNALMGGIAAAHGKYIIMGDADASYDFGEIPKFVEKLREGFDLVQGCRLPSGGGRTLPGAMPFLHRWWGNPMFSLMARWWFRAPIHDVYCGLRGFTKDLYHQLDQRCTGMEFATEMVIKSSLHGAKIGEVPITLHPDGRKSHAPHLKTFRDGWRTLRFFLIYSPRWLFLVPGVLLIVLGLVGYGLAMPGVTIWGATLDAHTLLFASLAILCGYQSLLFAIFTKTFAISEGLMPKDCRLTRFFELVNLERGLIVGLGALVVGLALLLAAVNQWRVSGFGPLSYSRTMRWVVPGATLTALGFQTVLSSFFVSILGMHRR